MEWVSKNALKSSEIQKYLSIKLCPNYTKNLCSTNKIPVIKMAIFKISKISLVLVQANKHNDRVMVHMKFTYKVNKNEVNKS